MKKIVVNSLSVLFTLGCLPLSGEPCREKAQKLWIMTDLSPASPAPEVQNSIASGPETEDDDWILDSAAEFLKEGSYDLAETTLESDLPYLEKTFGPDHPKVAQRLVFLGKTKALIGKLDEAEKILQKALRIYENTPESDREICDSQQSIAELLISTGNYGEAESLLHKALKIAEGSKSPDNLLIGNILKILGKLYQTIGKPGEAVAVLGSASKILDRELGIENPASIECFRLLGESFEEQGDFFASELIAKSCLADLEKKLGKDDLRLVGPLSHLGLLNTRFSRFDEAEPLLKRALGILVSKVEKDSPRIADIRESLGYLSEARGRFDEAEELYRLALKECRNDEEFKSYISPKILYGLGTTMIAKKNFGNAAEIFSKLIPENEALAGRVGLEELSEAFRENQLFYCQKLLAAVFHLQREEPEKARGYFPTVFAAMENARCRAFLDQFLRKSAASFSELSKEETIEERRLVKELKILDERCQKDHESGKDVNHKSVLGSLVIKKAGLRQDLKKLEEEFSRKYPKFSELRQPRPVTLDEVRKEILKPNEILISYWPTEDRLFAFTIARDGIKFAGHPVGSEVLQLQISQFSESILNQAPVNALKSAGVTLAKTLIKPFFSGEIPASSTLYIVAPGELGSVPWEALILDDTGDSFRDLSYFFRKVQVVYLPSATILRSLRNDTAKGRFSNPKRDPVLLFGDPVYSVGDGESPANPKKDPSRGTKINPGADEVLKFLSNYRISEPGISSHSVRGGTENGFLLKPLPETREEVETVSILFYGSKLSEHVYLGDRARESELKKLDNLGKLADYRILHFATHGLMPGEIAGIVEPSLVLSLQGETSEDGFLKLSEIFNLKLDSDIVVLSACQTGLEAIQPAKTFAPTPQFQGLSGLGQAFFYAGTPRLLGTLWSVSDKGSMEFMKKFYSYIKDQPLKSFPSGAIRKSREALLATEEFSHPFFWAPFVLFGIDE